MRRLFIAPVLALAAVGCSGRGRSAMVGGPDAGGRMVVQRAAGDVSTVVDGPARASYCAADSLLLIIGVGLTWSSGFAVRTVLPLAETRAFRIQPSLGELGTATAVFRPLRVGAAEFGTAGTVSLDPGTGVTGRFDLAVPDSGAEKRSFRGRWSAIPVRVLAGDSCAKS
jgi:hypothetical protein